MAKLNTSVEQGCIKLVKRNGKDIYNVDRDKSEPHDSSCVTDNTCQHGRWLNKEEWSEEITHLKTTSEKIE